MPGGNDNGANDGWGKRLGWFVLLWLGGVLTVGVLAYAIRFTLL